VCFNEAPSMMTGKADSRWIEAAEMAALQ